MDSPAGVSRVAAQQAGVQPAAGPQDSARAAVRQRPHITACALVSPLGPAVRYVLRGGPHVMTAAGNALGLAISQTACRAATNAAVNGGPAALWLGPDEQLLLGAEGNDIAAALGPALRELPHSLVDVSHRQTALQVSGPGAAVLLNAGCPLDLDPSAFPVGMCTRTVLAKAEIVLWRTAEDIFHIEVWRSFAAYVSRFLAEAAREIAL
jgi:sarcosine oxidase, subunit gamma